MPSDPAARPARPGLSLYANLLDPSSNKDSTPGTISRAPVVFKQPAQEDLPQDRVAAEKQQINAASLRFQPTKRPHLSTQKSKPKSSTSRLPAAAPSTLLPGVVPSESASVTARPPAKTTLADWTAEGEDNDVNGFYSSEKRQRGGRKKRKKNKEESHVPQNWDDIYDPSRPNNYEDYKHSDERIMEIREWKDRLYAHRLTKRRDSDSDSSGNEYRPQLDKQFAPPGLSFAPPVSFDDGGKSQHAPQSVEVLNDATGDDVYARRIYLPIFGSPAESLNYKPPASQVEPLPVPLPPPPPPPASDPPLTLNNLPPPPASISRAPVRYNLPAAPSEIPSSEAELEVALGIDLREEEEMSDAAPRSLRPGQKGFAERLMSKYGWSKGLGLGASGSGIVNPLRVQVEKQKKKPDSEGGGFVGPGGRGKIIGGKKKGGHDAEPEDGRFGVMSEVVVLRGMVDGMDLDAEMEGAGDGGLMQEIGEECGNKYGRVERVFIDRSDASKAPVFVKFTSQLSALRAVNALEGRIFNGNTISARFFDDEKFEAGNYE
ncbi:hypothetical protein HO173_011393 [Letharia columbiana]|uniref:G-patch domain-containing protein n=1 Tax=Letharia columbiana TaxID=112416 RepID=A0A8H6FJ69_9LECA|nr:uncharacterized protein HO173_011393 [Letharia columbiana]KAF6229538.1 hypothetical protein HO173_011393 [Letharia columbiana]